MKPFIYTKNPDGNYNQETVDKLLDSNSKYAESNILKNTVEPLNQKLRAYEVKELAEKYKTKVNPDWTNEFVSKFNINVDTKDEEIDKILSENPKFKNVITSTQSVKQKIQDKPKNSNDRFKLSKDILDPYSNEGE